MKTRLLFTFAVGFLVIGNAIAVDTPPSDASKTAVSEEKLLTPLPPATDEKKISVIKKEDALLRCQSEKLLKCLKMQKNKCETAISVSVDAVNSEIEKETGGKTLTEFDQAFYFGRAMGSFTVEMQKNTNGKFLGCLKKT